MNTPSLAEWRFQLKFYVLFFLRLLLPLVIELTMHSLNLANQTFVYTNICYYSFYHSYALKYRMASALSVLAMN